MTLDSRVRKLEVAVEQLTQGNQNLRRVINSQHTDAAALNRGLHNSIQAVKAELSPLRDEINELNMAVGQLREFVNVTKSRLGKLEEEKCKSTQFSIQITRL